MALNRNDESECKAANAGFIGFIAVACPRLGKIGRPALAAGRKVCHGITRTLCATGKVEGFIV